MKADQITVTITVNALTNKVWDYYTKPEHITKWNFANDDWHCPIAENDLRVGGKMKSRMEAKDGSFGFDFEGVYNEIIEYRKITYTMMDGRVASTVFEALCKFTKVTTSFDPDILNPVEMQRFGWQAILDNFKKHVETK